MSAVVRDMGAAEYHAIKALSAGMAITLDRECPLRAWLDSPFNPAQVFEHRTAFDIGTAAHLAVLEPELLAERAVLHEFDTYATKESRGIRDAAWAVGKTPLKPEEWDVVQSIAEALCPSKSAAGRLFTGGHPEVSLTWEWDGVPCKARPDYMPDSVDYLVDLKTANSANPRAVARKAFDEAWYVRAAWYLAGTEAATGKRPKHYSFVVVEKDPPHIAEVYELDDRSLIWGERIIGRVLRLFAECTASGRWPSYCGGKPTIIGLPGWAEFQLADREQAGEFDHPTLAETKQSLDWMKP
jgi:hypothetical protein